MTAIVAIEHPGGVLVGCDAFIGGSSGRESYDRPKWVHHARARLLIATAGAQRPGQIAELVSKFRPRRRGEDAVRYLVCAVLEPIRRAIAEHCEGESKDGFTALIAYDGGAYAVGADFGLFRSAHGYTAVGAGEPYCLASLATTADRDVRTFGARPLPPRERARLALEAAARHCNHVVGPYRYADVSRVTRR